MLYSYLVTVDNGSAPCVTNDLLSLAICKPAIRRCAKVNDIIVGFCAKSMKLNYNYPQILYIAKITKVISLDEYFSIHKERKDCIYDNNLNMLNNNFHSLSNKKTDLRGKHVSLSTDFLFFGTKHITLDSLFYLIVPKYQGHFSKKNSVHEQEFKQYFKELKLKYLTSKVGKHIHITNKICRVEKCVQLTNKSCITKNKNNSKNSKVY